MPEQVKFPLCSKYELNTLPCMMCGLRCCSTSETEKILGVLKNEYDELLLNRNEWKHESDRLEAENIDKDAELVKRAYKIQKLEKDLELAKEWREHYKKELKTAREQIRLLEYEYKDR